MGYWRAIMVLEHPSNVESREPRSHKGRRGRDNLEEGEVLSLQHALLGVVVDDLLSRQVKFQRKSITMSFLTEIKNHAYLHVFFLHLARTQRSAGPFVRFCLAP